ncbi:hypothetical protein CKAH01_17685 [Colletotrichum kahawae]|uniref:Uncharacterized protein n=1 Tax=Colletotrichum kahawae TaxID=34407 RepID=A0AAE0D408_COLKA|nr:hypothetical protein CKAH01_17685 [Colletotrichum kahawae]
MRPPETLTTRSVDTSTTSKHSSSIVAKGQAREDDNAHIQSVPKHHQQVSELDISHPGFREVPANVTRIAAGTRSAAAPPPNQPQAAPLNRRRPLTRKSKKKNRRGDNSDSGSEPDNTNRRGNNDNYSASRRPEGAPEVLEAVLPPEYQRQMRQKEFDWMRRLKKAGQTCEEFHEQCAKNREIGEERLEKLANDPRASQSGRTHRAPMYHPDLRRILSNQKALRTRLKIWESRRRAHFDKVLYSYFQAALRNDCPMEAPIDMFDTPQRIVEAVEAEMVHCLGWFSPHEDSAGTDLASGSTNNKVLVCQMIQQMYRCADPFWELNRETEMLTATDSVRQKIREIQVPETSTVGKVTRTYVDKIMTLIENFNAIDYEYQNESGCEYVVRRISEAGLGPINYLRWILDARDENSLLVYIRGLQWKQTKELRASRRIRQEMFYPGDSSPGLVWSVLWSWDQPKMFEEFSKDSIAELGWFYEESEQARFVQYQRRSAYLDECESTDDVMIKVSMTKEVIGMCRSDGQLITLDS